MASNPETNCNSFQQTADFYSLRETPRSTSLIVSLKISTSIDIHGLLNNQNESPSGSPVPFSDPPILSSPLSEHRNLITCIYLYQASPSPKPLLLKIQFSIDNSARGSLSDHDEDVKPRDALPAFKPDLESRACGSMGDRGRARERPADGVSSE